MASALFQVDFSLYIFRSVLLTLFIWLLQLQLVEGAWRPELGNPHLEALPTTSPSSGAYTWNVVWDKQGRAYFGRERLWRWDGTKYRAMGPDHFRLLRGMAVDSKGMLWLGGVNQFGVFNPEDGQYESRMDWIPQEHRDFGEVWTIHCDGEVVWMGTHHRLFRFENGAVQVWRFGGLHRVMFHFIGNSVFAHEAAVGLWKIQNGKRKLVNEDHDVSADSIVFLDRFEDDLLYGFSKHGIIALSSDGSELISFSPNPIQDSLLSCGARFEDKLILGTLGSGLYLVSKNGKVLHSFKRNGDDLNGLILNVKIQSDNRLWILDEASVIVFNLGVSVGYRDLSTNITRGKVTDAGISDGQIFAATDIGLFVLPEANGRKTTPSRVSFSESKSALRYKGGYLFDRYNKILWTDGEGVREVVSLPGEIISFTVSGKDVLWALLSDRMLAYGMKVSGELELLAERDGLTGLLELGSDDSGHVWGWAPGAPLAEIEFVEGEGERIEVRWHEEICGFNLREAEHNFAMTEEGPLLVLEDTLLRFRRGTEGWTSGRFEHGNGMPETMKFRSKDGVLKGWLIYREEKFGCTIMKELEWMEGSDPVWQVLPWIDLTSLGHITALEVVEANPTKFFIGGSQGVLLAEETLSDELPLPQTPLIYADAGLFESPESLESRFGEAHYRFRFSPPDGQIYYPLRVETRLRGLDNSWRGLELSEVRELGQLFEGTYVLEVRTRDPFGRVSPAANLKIRINPPWYRTIYAYLAGFLALILVILLIIRYRERRLHKQKAYLAGLVRERTADLEKANQFKDEFIANLSHEIRNPLNGVIGLISQLNPGKAPPDRYIGALQGAADYLQTTVEEVLDFSKLQSGELRVEKSFVDLRKLVNGVVAIYRSQAAKKGVDITAQVRIPEGIGICSDSTKINQILGNLTGNAVKFTKAGTVHVGVLLVTEEKAKGTLRIWVEDSGPGIPESEKAKIFEKFYQVKEGVQQTRGTGLGLALVKRYVDCLEGQIELKSEMGKGSTFQVVLPVETVAFEAAEADPIGNLTGRLDGLAVLVVEDMEYNRIVMEGLLSRSGCKVDFAEDGPKGLEMALSRTYRVIFLDWDLPGMKGLEVARRLRQDHQLAEETRIIGMTAFATADVREKCLAAGMDDFLTKPLSEEQIYRVLAEHSEAPPIILGRGLLAEMDNGRGWDANLHRWSGFYHDYLDALKTAVAGREPEAVRKAAHRLLGHLNMLELRDIPDALKDLLTVAHAADINGIRKEWEILSLQLEQFSLELERLKKS